MSLSTSTPNPAQPRAPSSLPVVADTPSPTPHTHHQPCLCSSCHLSSRLFPRTDDGKIILPSPSDHKRVGHVADPSDLPRRMRRTGADETPNIPRRVAPTSGLGIAGAGADVVQQRPTPPARENSGSTSTERKLEPGRSSDARRNRSVRVSDEERLERETSAPEPVARTGSRMNTIRFRQHVVGEPGGSSLPSTNPATPTPGVMPLTFQVKWDSERKRRQGYFAPEGGSEKSPFRHYNKHDCQ